MLFGGLPAANITTACTMLEKAIQLNPNYLLYQLDYAKALHDADKNEQAVLQLKKVMVAKPNSQDDPSIMAEANRLLQKWQ